jgi:hypothetical protein
MKPTPAAPNIKARTKVGRQAKVRALYAHCVAKHDE